MVINVNSNKLTLLNRQNTNFDITVNKEDKQIYDYINDREKQINKTMKKTAFSEKEMSLLKKSQTTIFERNEIENEKEEETKNHHKHQINDDFTTHISKSNYNTNTRRSSRSPSLPKNEDLGNEDKNKFEQLELNPYSDGKIFSSKYDYKSNDSDGNENKNKYSTDYSDIYSNINNIPRFDFSSSFKADYSNNNNNTNNNSNSNNNIFKIEENQDYYNNTTSVTNNNHVNYDEINLDSYSYTNNFNFDHSDNQYNNSYKSRKQSEDFSLYNINNNIQIDDGYKELRSKNYNNINEYNKSNDNKPILKTNNDKYNSKQVSFDNSDMFSNIFQNKNNTEDNNISNNKSNYKIEINNDHKSIQGPSLVSPIKKQSTKQTSFHNSRDSKLNKSVNFNEPEIIEEEVTRNRLKLRTVKKLNKSNNNILSSNESKAKYDFIFIDDNKNDKDSSMSNVNLQRNMFSEIISKGNKSSVKNLLKLILEDEIN